MLILSRKVGETIQIGRDITIMVTQVRRGEVRIGISAPDGVDILRGELHKPIAEQVEAKNEPA